MKYVTLFFALLAVGLAWHGRAHSDAPLAATIRKDCGSVKQCIAKRIEAGLAARGEYSQVRVYCPTADGVQLVCDSVLDDSSDDPACFRYWLDPDTLRLLKSVDESNTLLCRDLVN